MSTLANRNLLTFVNHACFTVQNDSALLLADPWVEGSAFNDGWSLLDRSTGNAALVAQLNRTGLPVYVWCSNARPDRLSLSFVRTLKEEFRGKVSFLFQQAVDRHMVGMLRQQGFEVLECPEGAPVSLGHDMRISVFPHAGGDSWCVITSGGRTVLNLNGCTVSTIEQCRALKAKVAKVAPRVDLLLTRCAYAGWVGNPGALAVRKAAAHEQVRRLALQATELRPKIVVPIASFFHFSHPENAYLNEGQTTPQAVAESPHLARLPAPIRFLRPGALVDLDGDNAQSLLAGHEQAVAHWMGLLKAGAQLAPTPAPLPLADVKAAFMAYRAQLGAVPRVLEWLRVIRPLALHLADLQQTVQLSYGGGLKVLDRKAPADIAMSSANAVFLFKSDSGHDTTVANGRFRTVHTDGLKAFARFFMPQRVARAGYDRRHPLAMAQRALRKLVARATRQVQGALR